MLFKAQAWLPAPNKANASGATMVQPKHASEKASLTQRLTVLHNYNGLAKPALLCGLPLSAAHENGTPGGCCKSLPLPVQIEPTCIHKVAMLKRLQGA